MRPVCTAHAQKGQNTTSGFRFDHAIRSGMVENLYSHEILAKNAILGDFEPYFYCACAETVIILLPVSNLTTPFDPACPKTYMFKKSWLKTRFCRYFSRMSNFCPILCIGDFLRMRVKPEVVVRFYCPTNSSSQFWSRTTVQNLVTIG